MLSTLLSLALAATPCQAEIVVLGTSQDAGTPQIGNPGDPGWSDPAQRAWASSLALIDHANGKRYLFDATPDLREQLHWLDMHDPSPTRGLGIDGIFLTHAHIGHYAGLMFLGRESAGSKGMPVYAMPRMARFLTGNGPWGQLVTLNNIALRPLEANKPAPLKGFTVTPYPVPHRDEYSETVGFVIAGSSAKALYLPDIDGWDLWETRMGVRIEEMIAGVDIAFLDATFFDDAELGGGRAMAEVPHPRVAASIARFAKLPADVRARIRFTHLNHTNKARFAGSEQRRAIVQSGMKLAEMGERFCLSQPSAPSPISPR